MLVAHERIKHMLVGPPTDIGDDIRLSQEIKEDAAEGIEVRRILEQ